MLLGKITTDKLSNFVEFIDCFILLACPNNTFTDMKALMKPIVSPMDVKIAFEQLEWNLSYTFDSSQLLTSYKNNNNNKIDDKPTESIANSISSYKYNDIELDRKSVV